jgi:SAM-dependent methyltransferase
VSPPRRTAILPRLGLAPSVPELVRAAIDEVLGERDAATATALDAGCGRASLLAGYRSRLRRFVGADLHGPAAGALAELDDFVEADLCSDTAAFPPASFDLVLSSFTVEHFSDPRAAFRNIRTWLRPGGRLILTTVNRRHPFVALYLALPASLRRRLQVIVKSGPADAHPLVGACNSIPELRAALGEAGFVDVRVETAAHLARAWGRRWPTFVLGVLGDLAARPFEAGRSTIVARAVVAPGV